MKRFFKNILKACAFILAALAFVFLFLFFFPLSAFTLSPLKSGLIFLAAGALSAFFFRGAKALSAPKTPTRPPVPQEHKADDTPN